ncbi:MULTISPECIES: helix-turn-helix transcriptional regulator [unclassified Methanosarcina]|uniref:ArsR/SmtB family transcription factor n=1 Tax=unclassified Methanosarcina TaxID=2644672 RepID=UPI00061596D1|nr:MULTISPECIES: metalloregulator ArsR/SmtB family transcription factor [unclassified Methanosarcina]AKB17732.1 putative transcriptional regulator, ArsR family [Methanosarcina sp. WWM596]AKB21086.1 putative transcriptional regulator, ArsR family [Methanosarcina sp. WH1]
MLDSKVKLFKALGDETRLTILSYLLEHSYCACDFSSLTKKDQTTVSKHLKVLVEAGILKYERQGRNIIYSIKNEEIECLLVSLGIMDIKSCCDEQQVSRVCHTDKTENRIHNIINERTDYRDENKAKNKTKLNLEIKNEDVNNKERGK